MSVRDSVTSASTSLRGLVTRSVACRHLPDGGGRHNNGAECVLSTHEMSKRCDPEVFIGAETETKRYTG